MDMRQQLVKSEDRLVKNEEMLKHPQDLANKGRELQLLQRIKPDDHGVFLESGEEFHLPEEVRGKYDIVSSKKSIEGIYGPTLIVSHKVSRRSYLLKLINKESCTERKLSHIQSVIETLNTFHHENILPIHHFMQTGKFICLFFEATSGIPQTGLKEAEAFLVFVQICKAAQFVDLHNFPLCSLKRENFRVSNGNGQVKLLCLEHCKDETCNFCNSQENANREENIISKLGNILCELLGLKIEVIYCIIKDKQEDIGSLDKDAALLVTSMLHNNINAKPNILEEVMNSNWAKRISKARPKEEERKSFSLTEEDVDQLLLNSSIFSDNANINAIPQYTHDKKVAEIEQKIDLAFNANRPKDTEIITEMLNKAVKARKELTWDKERRGASLDINSLKVFPVKQNKANENAKIPAKVLQLKRRNLNTNNKKRKTLWELLFSFNVSSEQLQPSCLINF
eukprot:TRINITY_DN782_c0_g2_i1.p1 TRINITY_DN782_c0_g2~~TRINITY_DN782_c0_g2_i1.p1  ORF type:complete len:454 (-),score=48.88 TRINITY_DN782_c0_g2_i1:2493-3854(-)